MSRPHLFTPEVLALIPIWVSEGVTTPQIAGRIGCRVSSLYTICCKHRISLQPRARSIDPEFRVVLSVTPGCRRRLRLEAAKFDLTADQLAELLLETISNDNLFSAVIDQ
jgi:hypothetical protein